MIRRAFAVTLACLALSGTALAQDKLGILILHGKQGSPTHNQGLSVIASALQSAGHKVSMPAEPWGRGQWENINLTVEQTLALLDGQIAQLRAQGANRFVVIGHSLGACLGLSYAVERANLAGLVMLAPGHNPGSVRGAGDSTRDFDRARALIAQGKGGEIMSGTDSNQGNTFTMTVSATVYASWHDPDGLASMTHQAPRLPASTPLLIVVGDRDPIAARAEGAIYRPAAKNPYSRYVTDGATHLETPMAASKLTIDWVQGLPR
ncbi:MAG: alpha/beta hydrolase [Alphaproteobacteria bacterium]|nr:alpha/beta hydrolase [Alphaproteobacteria bacterium]